jgi:hypothetical protein
MSQDRRSYLLAEFRCAALRARLWQADIDAAGLALKAGLATPEQALAMLDEAELELLAGRAE